MVRHIYVGIIMSPAKLLYWTIDKTDADYVSYSVRNINSLRPSDAYMRL